MFNRILIANRGEIACRVIRTAQKLGIETIAIYSTADEHALHVLAADKAYWIGDSTAKESYLNIAAIIKVAKESGAEAIHPGYGFLSENPEFARACEKEGLIFIGPTPEAMEAMASKQLAKQLLQKSNVPLTPGYHGDAQEDDVLLSEAKKIGFPVLLKAANGGGGKGMRAVFDEAGFKEALQGARRESKAFFADETMLIEKLVLNARHIEVQIMADNFGEVVHLFERDCSIQRRHQKIIEEAPAPNLSGELRQAITNAACQVARSINYRGAGTVEFLLAENGEFYFMEMNTRLQVEHPVTEMITGEDLVAWQLKIASNEPLPSSKDSLRIKGHAIECRIYAEDPFNEFMPSVGKIDFLEEPQGEGIRIDTGVGLHSTISRYYDPMIAKLICYGNTREEALNKTKRALKAYAISGVKTNIPFLEAIAENNNFIKANFSTDFLNQEKIQLEKPNKQLAFILAASLDYLKLSDTKEPLLQANLGFRLHLEKAWNWDYRIEDEKESIKINAINKNSFELGLGDATYKISAFLQKGKLSIHLNNEILSFLFANEEQGIYFYLPQGPLFVHRFQYEPSKQNQAHKKDLVAPMTSTVVAILKSKGDKVKEGESLIVLEAMKMEHTIFAPKDGVLAELFYEVGAQVNEGAELLALKEH